MKSYKAPRGTKDIFEDEIYIFRTITKKAFEVSKKFEFKEIITPTFEDIELFRRSVGNYTDIVQKEMFSFNDKAKREFALRPEGTPCVVRASLEHGLINGPLPVKLFYIINCFRNERPQAGRYKEFYQFGVEIFGSSCPSCEVELISFAQTFFEELKLNDIELNINSIGCFDCRKKFIEKLVSYFETKKESLCKYCIDRLYKNPLRILDCKNSKCTKLTYDAPNILENICTNCLDHFETVLELLDYCNIKYKKNPRIVRGLDYYTKTVFEFKSKKLGSQDTLCGGGRYDDLVEIFGGEKTPALGFGIGINRLILLLKEKKDYDKRGCDIYISYIGKKALFEVVKFANLLRKKNIVVQTELLKRSPKASMKYANKIKAKFSAIIGENELFSKKAIIKNMEKKESFKVSLDGFVEEFTKILKTS